MRKSKKYKYRVYDGKIIKDMLENSRLYLMLLLFVVGLIIGALAIENSASLLVTEIRGIVESYKVLRMQQSFMNNFAFSLLVNLMFIGASVFLAFSLIGYPFIIWLPLFKGIGMGAVCGYLYSVYELTGIGYALLTIYPSAIIAVIAIVVSCNDSCEYSKNAYMKAVGGKGNFERGETRIFLIRQLVFGSITAAASLIDAVSGLIFSRFFSF